jgi:hypothetical protein|tara:strand:- start:46 stop:318 length:273 start_codon:yes stop_codon:yes gene_type:complete
MKGEVTVKPKTPRENAMELLDSLRGHYIVGQALSLAIKEIESRPFQEQEPSNVADMTLLRDELFPMYKDVEDATQEAKDNGIWPRPRNYK